MNEVCGRRRASLALLIPVGLLLAVVGGCVSGGGGGVGGFSSALDQGDDPEALLLVMSDGLLYESIGVSELLRRFPETHARLAEILGRVGDPRGLPILEDLLRDSRVEVRRSAAFALGLVRSKSSGPALAIATVDEDEETGRLAVEALTRIGEPFRLWSGALATLPADARGRRLYPSLFRLTHQEIDEVVTREREGLDAAALRWLVYAAGRSGGEGGLPLLRQSLGSEDAWVRGWAARGLGRLGRGEDLARLLPLLADAEVSPVVQALRAAARLIESAEAAPPAEWYRALVSLTVDDRTGVRLAVLEVVGAWIPNRPLEERLLVIVEQGEARERALALLALARGRAESAEELTLRASLAPEISLRAAAATAAGRLGIPEALELLWADPEPAVRLAAFAALVDRDEEKATDYARRALVDQDSAVRAAALEWLAEYPGAPIEELLQAIQGRGASRMPDLVINGVLALEARHAEALERGAVLASLEELARDSEFLVRRAAADALERLGRPRPDIGWASRGLGLGTYRDVAAGLDERHFVVMTTRRGEITFELACSEAPLTCWSFLQLTNQGFYDGMTFHRVVPDFVVQGGDPRGDGWGGPGFTIRDEPTRLRFERGVLGMAKSTRDDAGSQFFVTLSDQPHLDGEYTAFGRVVAGEEVLDQIVQGDSLEAIVEIEDGSIAGIDSRR